MDIKIRNKQINPIIIYAGIALLIVIAYLLIDGYSMIAT